MEDSNNNQPQQAVPALAITNRKNCTSNCWLAHGQDCHCSCQGNNHGALIGNPGAQQPDGPGDSYQTAILIPGETSPKTQRPTRARPQRITTPGSRSSSGSGSGSGKIPRKPRKEREAMPDPQTPAEQENKPWTASALPNPSFNCQNQACITPGVPMNPNDIRWWPGDPNTMTPGWCCQPCVNQALENMPGPTLKEELRRRGWPAQGNPQ